MLRRISHKRVRSQRAEPIGASGAPRGRVVYNGDKEVMNKKIIIAVLVLIILGVALAIFFFARKNPSTTGVPGDITGTLPIETTTPPGPPPTGDTITLGTTQGDVTTKNFYKSADYTTQDKETVVVHATSTYSIVYNVSDSSFIITLLAMPLEAARQAAETAFLSYLGVSKQDACKLNVYEGVPASVSDQYSGTPIPLSFCGNASPL